MKLLRCRDVGFDCDHEFRPVVREAVAPYVEPNTPRRSIMSR